MPTTMIIPWVATIRGSKVKSRPTQTPAPSRAVTGTVPTLGDALKGLLVVGSLLRSTMRLRLTNAKAIRIANTVAFATKVRSWKNTIPTVTSMTKMIETVGVPLFGEILPRLLGKAPSLDIP